MTGYRIPSNAETVAASAASAVGATLTEVGRANLVAAIETFGTITPGQPVTITIDGDEKGVLDYVRGLVSETPSWFKPVAVKAMEASKTTPTDEAMTARAIRLNALAKSGRDAAARARAEALVAKHGNPFRSGNITHQHVVKSGAPDLAERLRQEAAR